MKLKNKKKLLNSSGFSLMELVVVITIIGVLASIAIPRISVFQAKARQTEAKVNLASYYLAQRAFHAEYGGYDARFGAIGFSPEGKLHYNIGTGGGSFGSFVDPSNSNSIIGYSAVNSLDYCTIQGAGCDVSTSALPSLVTPEIIAVDGFTAQAIGVINNTSGSNDVWTIDQSKTLVNRVSGL